MAASGPANIVARRVTDDLIAFSGETAVPKYMKLFLVKRLLKAAFLSTACSMKLIPLGIALDAKRGEEGKLMALNDVFAEAFDEIKTQEENVQILDAASDGVYGMGWVSFVLVIMFSVRVVF
ncbi:hypothetical protein Tco_1359560 [Tanacetum coccineum]